MEDEDKLTEQVEKAGRSLDNQIRRKKSQLPVTNNIGICETCSYLSGCVDNLGNIVRLRCEYYEINLSIKRSMSHCTAYVKAGTMSLNEMTSMAWMIDIKKPMGFKREGR